MLSKNPNLSPAVVDSILEITALDLGPAGKDNDFGAGRIDALEAVNYVTGSGGPMLFARAVAVHDSQPGGNNNGRLDPGENARLRITLRNSGGAACNNTVGTFISGDARLTVNDPDGAWGDIPSGGEATNTNDPFAVTASGLIPPGTVVACTLVVTGDSADYSTRINVALTVGVPPPRPGMIIWGPRLPSNQPTQWGLYGLTYNTAEDLIYCAYYMAPTIYKYSSDSLLTVQGTVTAPEDSCTDIDYCSYDNTFWLVGNASKTLYKITPTGTVLRQFSLAFADYPLGVTEFEDEHTVFISDRRNQGQTQQRLFVLDTAGNLLDTIIHPVAGNYGSRCLSLDDGTPTNPPSLINLFTWFNVGGTAIDSTGVLEIDRVGNTVLNRFKFTNTAWNPRGVEVDPRDGSYWITIMQGTTPDNQIMKVVGFNYGVGVEEERGLPARPTRLKVEAFPNPFTGRTMLSVALPGTGAVDLKVFDNNGRLVRVLASGAPVSRRANWAWDGRDRDGRTVAPGVYFYRASAAGDEAWGKVILSR
jgi:hypothetical protein